MVSLYTAYKCQVCPLPAARECLAREEGMPETSVLEFPCEFPVKALGRAGGALEQAVDNIMRRHVPDFDAEAMRSRRSRHGSYISVTVTVRATSREQLDAIYRELSRCRSVMMAL